MLAMLALLGCCFAIDPLASLGSEADALFLKTASRKGAEKGLRLVADAHLSSIASSACYDERQLNNSSDETWDRTTLYEMNPVAHFAKIFIGKLPAGSAEIVFGGAVCKDTHSMRVLVVGWRRLANDRAVVSTRYFGRFERFERFEQMELPFITAPACMQLVIFCAGLTLSPLLPFVFRWLVYIASVMLAYLLLAILYIVARVFALLARTRLLFNHVLAHTALLSVPGLLVAWRVLDTLIAKPLHPLITELQAMIWRVPLLLSLLSTLLFVASAVLRAAHADALADLADQAMQWLRAQLRHLSAQLRHLFAQLAIRFCITTFQAVFNSAPLATPPPLALVNIPQQPQAQLPQFPPQQPPQQSSSRRCSCPY